MSNMNIPAFLKYEKNQIKPFIWKEITKNHSLATQNFINKMYQEKMTQSNYIDLAKDIYLLPENYMDEIILDNKLMSNDKIDDGNSGYKVDMRIFANILEECFGESHDNKRKYISIDNLYTILPIIYIMNNSVLESIDINGVYIYDIKNKSLKLLKKIADSSEIFDDILYESNQYNSILFGYAINFNRALAAHQARGYRYALIELGSLAQNVESVLNKYDFKVDGINEFNDFSLTKNSALSPYNAPISYLQMWCI